jgi:antitoxin component YwqK of YwqJK toxin-antitoxin module
MINKKTPHIMKKYILILIVLFVGTSVFAQEKNRVKHKEIGDMVDTTYYSADGSIQQQGTFNKKGKLHGTWISYDIKGNKTAIGNYENGKKAGKWTFLINGEVQEVDYVDSKVTKVSKVNNAAAL